MALKFDKTLFTSFALPFFLDRVTKYFMISGLWRTMTINSVFNIYLTHNHGIAWGVGSQFYTNEFCWLNLLIACVLIYFIWYMKSILHHFGMTVACLLILAGGVSNFCDRLWYGSVIDFIQLHIGDWYFPVFNIADISITLGAIALTYFVLLSDEK